MCPTTTWFGRITMFSGLLLLFVGKSTITAVLGYILIAAAFIYSIFFTDRSCQVNYTGQEENTGDDGSKNEAEVKK